LNEYPTGGRRVSKGEKVELVEGEDTWPEVEQAAVEIYRNLRLLNVARPKGQLVRAMSPGRSRRLRLKIRAVSRPKFSAIW
jgi:hypothetical protein